MLSMSEQPKAQFSKSSIQQIPMVNNFPSSASNIVNLQFMYHYVTFSLGDLAQRPVFIEELSVFPNQEAVDKLKVVRDEVGGRAKLVALAKDQVAAVPLSRCSLIARSCGVCVALQDPYCAWSVREGQCVSLENSNVEILKSSDFLQVWKSCFYGFFVKKYVKIKFRNFYLHCKTTVSQCLSKLYLTECADRKTWRLRPRFVFRYDQRFGAFWHQGLPSRI